MQSLTLHGPAGPFVTATINVGSMVLYDSSVVHRGSANSYGEVRQALMASYTKVDKADLGEGDHLMKILKEGHQTSSLEQAARFREAFPGLMLRAQGLDEQRHACDGHAEL